MESMWLKKLNIVNFKNWEQGEFEFSPNINCLVGLNGAGKTNVLDAICYLTQARSYFNAIDSQNVLFDADFFVLQGGFERNGSSENIYLGLKKGGKKNLRRNDSEYQRLADHVGFLPSVMISPYDRDLITEGSEQRRKLMDSIISGYDKLYLDALLRYNKALMQRNQLLKSFHEKKTWDGGLLEIYNFTLSEYGGLIHEARKKFIEFIKPLFLKFYNEISGSAEEVDILYQSDLYSKSITTLLKENEQRDSYLLYTSKGAHKDDLEFTLGGYPLKKFGSQGQQKSFLIALKMAQFYMVKEKSGLNPILMLDDIFDKLDEQRVEQLIALVNKSDYGQIFITDTHPERTLTLAKKFDAEAAVFYIQNGCIYEKA